MAMRPAEQVGIEFTSWRMTMTNCVRVMRDGFNWVRSKDIHTGQWSGPWRRG